MSDTKSSQVADLIRKRPFTFLALMLIIPLFVTAPHVLLDSETPQGIIIQPPEIHDPLSDGFILIILDGVGENWMLDEVNMPLLNERRETGATLNLRTGPLTLSATCVSEIMNGVPNSPSDGLRNFNLEHPGGDDAWTLASKIGVSSTNSPYNVGLVGSYVYGNMYGDMENLDFIDTFLGHADYYQGDEDTAEVLFQWFENDSYNVIGAHFSGPDKVGHRWGTTGEKYAEKITHIDGLIDEVLDEVPENWTIIVTADHGMTKLGTHGSSQDVTREVAALVWGPQIIPGSQSEGHQRDIPALSIAVLDLPFPVQLHGQIPLDILNISAVERNELEKWNWQAAYERQIFLQSIDRPAAKDISPDIIEWEKIPIDAEFTRFIDLLISASTWSLLAASAILLIGMGSPKTIEERRVTSIFITVLTIMILSHAFIGYVTIIPRLIGAFSSLWIVWWTLNNYQKNTNREGKILIWVNSMPDWWPWLAAALVLSFGSIRLWFTLIPLTWIVLSQRFRNNELQNKNEKLALSILGFISLLGITGVHERLVGEHWVLHLVQLGWPENTTGILFSVLILSITGPMYNYLSSEKEFSKQGIFISIWLLLILFVNWLEISNIDLLTLLIILLVGIIGLLQRTNIFSGQIMNIKLPKELDIIALGGFLVLTWGAWSASITLLLISSIDVLMRTQWKWITLEKYNLKNPKPFIAAAVLPLVMWILWWTMLGQVNGLEAWALPHPRELDPGRIVVKGGYVGARDNPPTEWMSLLIALPLLLSSTAIVSKLRQRNLSLRPYALALSLQLVGCFATLAFAPPFPRLVFSLTWNIVFSIFQILAVLLSLSLVSINKKVNQINIKIVISD
ncbi:MAG: alkaline phosphatase family protein [Candidatus Thalassarchaeaceae archaeon]